MSAVRSILACLLFLPAASGLGQTFDLAGYAKNLTVQSRSVVDDESFILNTSRFRLKGSIAANDAVEAELWLDSELLSGDFLQTLDFQLSRAIARPTFVDLEWTVEEQSHYQLRQSLFRAFAKITAGSAEVTVGRQRIAWGTGFAWNPTDLLNPYNPIAIELQERTGVDAVHVAIPLGNLSRLEAAFAPGRKRLRSSYAARLTTNFHEYDLSLMAGHFRDDTALGTDFAGYLGDAGFRGEFAYTFRDDDSDYLRAVVNLDYSFPHDFYALVEFYYNGQGQSDKARYNLLDVLNGETFNLAKLYTAASVSKSISPLLNAGIYSIVNLNDRSSLIGPTLTYSLATNLEISANTYLLFGADDSEYGQLETSHFASVQYFF